MSADYRRIIGRKLVLGFDGTELPESFIRLVRAYKVGNVILFRRNIVNEQQLRRLTQDIQLLITETTGMPALITIDEEGGLVSRLGMDSVHVPCAMGVAATGSVSNAEQTAKILARQLAGTGVNFNLAPVLDVNSNPANPVIGERSFGDDPQRVALFGAASVRGYEGTGVLCIGKHFPGHGDTAVDSHIGLPVVNKALQELESCELVPFRAAIEAGIPAIMTSHILFPQLETDRIPATMSRAIMTGLLREKLGFKGLIMSDCLHMEAIRTYYGVAKGAVAAMKAGVDLLIISTGEEEQIEAAEALIAAAEAGDIAEQDLLASEKRIIDAVQKALVVPEPQRSGLSDDEAAAQALSAQSLVHARGHIFTPNSHTFFCGPQDYRAALVGNPDGAVVHFPDEMCSVFGGTGAINSRNPDDTQIRRLVDTAQASESIVFATCNAHLSPGQIKLANAFAATGKPLMIAVLRNPYDVPLLPEGAGIVCIWDYDRHAMKAFASALKSMQFPGIMPVRL